MHWTKVWLAIKSGPWPTPLPNTWKIKVKEDGRGEVLRQDEVGQQWKGKILSGTGGPDS
jgi:hypothetical protein